MALHVLTRIRAGGLGLAAALLASVGAAPDASAQSSIGTAAIVRNDVARLRGGGATPLVGGDAVFLNDTVRTGVASSARLAFRDATSLSIGSSATIRLDNTVYADGRPAPKTVVNLTEGAFRFISGKVAPKAVEVRTEVATIGIRGTEFDVLASPLNTVVTLRAGVVVICPLSGPRVCVTLRAPGETASVTAGGPAVRSQTQISFSSFCAADPALCNPRVQLAGPLPAAAPPTSLAGALCGR